MKTRGLSGAEAFLKLLAGMGVDRIFASPGSEWAPVWETLANPTLKSKPMYLSSRHEEIAVAMASGYAKATGRLPAVMLHTTVGALHASMGMRGALHENVPMVVFAGESIRFGEQPGPDPGGHWLAQLADVGGPARLVERCAKWSFAINTKAILPATIQRACQLAMTAPRGPVFVSIPMEFLFETMSVDAATSASIPLSPTADYRGLDELADMLFEAEHPVIVTEECGRNAAAVDRLVEFSDLLAIPVVETRTAGYVNFPRDHPLHVGFDPLAILAETDLVLLIGAIAPWHPASASPKNGSRVVVLDENPLRPELPYWGYQVDLCLTGALESSLHLLLEKVKKRISCQEGSRAQRLNHWAKRHQDQVCAWRDEAVACKDEKPLDMRWILHEMNEVLPANAIVVEETITHRDAVNRYLSRLKPGQFFSGAIGGLGTGLGTALGVKSASPDQPVILVIGDGSFNYNPVLAALGYAQEYRMPIMVVILNNHGFLSQKQGIPLHYPDGWAVKTSTFVGTSISPSPEYSSLATVFGGFGEKVEDPNEVRSSLTHAFMALASGKLVILDMSLKPVN